MLEWLPNDVNQKTTQEYIYIKENISEINDINKLPEGISPINKFTNNWPIITEISQPNG